MLPPGHSHAEASETKELGPTCATRAGRSPKLQQHLCPARETGGRIPSSAKCHSWVDLGDTGVGFCHQLPRTLDSREKLGYAKPIIAF